MSVGDIAGLIAAITFVLLVGFLAVPLVKLGRVLDAARESVSEVTAHTVPIIDEAAVSVTQANNQLVRIDTITTRVAEVSTNVSALTSLVSATVGRPLIKVASFSYAVRSVLGGRRRGRGGSGR